MAGESHKPVPSERGLKVNERLTIPENELTWQFTRSGGPGGQHANTSDTRVDVRYDVTTSAVLSDRQRARLIEQFGDEARVMVDRHRSQWKNRVEAALSWPAGSVRRWRHQRRLVGPPGPPVAPSGGGSRPNASRARRRPTAAVRRWTEGMGFGPAGYSINSSFHSV